MESLTLEQTANYLETSKIESTADLGCFLIHVGKNAAGTSFVMVNDVEGRTTINECM